MNDPKKGRRWQRLLQDGTPIFSGMLVDMVDLLTPSSVGVVIGMPAGAAVGYLVSVISGLSMKYCLLVALLCGLYCSTPGTEAIPLGTLVGLGIVIVRWIVRRVREPRS
jgi:hypothetical protein